MVSKKEIWSILSTVIISMVLFNFGMKYAAKVNPELLDIILGSTKLDRFAEALGYYTPVAAPDVFTINEDAPVESLDVFDNDYDEDSNGLYFAQTNPITAITGDTAAAVTTNAATISTNDTAAVHNGLNTTYGEVEVDTSDNYQGQLMFTYEMCDSVDGSTSGNESPTPGVGCATADATVNINAVNDRPEVDDFAIQTDQGVTYSFDNGSNPTLFEQNFRDPDQIFLNENPTATPSVNEGYDLFSLQVYFLPQKGTLFIDDGTSQTNISPFQVIPAADVPNIRYIPDPIESGNDSFVYAANDSESFPIFPDNIELDSLGQPINTQDFGPTATVSITINQADAPTLADQTYTIKRGETKTFPPITATQTGNQTITSVTVNSLPTNINCVEATPGANGNILSCTAPINAPIETETFTVTATNSAGLSTTATFSMVTEDFDAPTVALTSDTPDNEVEIDKDVCITGTVTNPNDYDLENVIVRMITNENRAPFVLGSAVSQVTGATFTETINEIAFTLPLLPANGTGEVEACATPKVTDISFIDASTFVQDSDKITTDNVQLDPPEEETTETPLVRSGANRWSSTILQLTIVEGLIAFLIIMYYNANKKKKVKQSNSSK